MMTKYQLPIETIITRLGYDNSENLLRNEDFYGSKLSSHTVKILSEINPYAVYFLDGKPFILFFDKIYDKISFKQVSMKVWNTQIPIVFFCDDYTVKVYNGTSLDISSYILNKVTEIDIDNCTAYTDFSYWEISNHSFWGKYLLQYSKTKLNEHLLSNITYLTTKLKNDFHIDFATKLVLRLIFIRYLIDRGVDLAYGKFSYNIEESQKELLNIIRKKELLYDLFLHLKLKFNGNLFDLGNEIDSPNLTDEVFGLLSEFLSGTISMDNGQLSLFALYDFKLIPVELISNIYEILLGKEIRSKDNAFYTPNYLVEYILDKTVLSYLKKNKKFKILDPACGSGVFLVDSFRRIIEENLGDDMYLKDDTILKTLLTENIYGIDINEEAIDVTIFSLYLTILDYKDPKTLAKFILPNLKGINLFVSDFFEDEKLSELKKIKFDFIIGNPPWGNVKNGLHMKYCKKNGYKDIQQNNEISRSFVFRAKDFSTDNTVCCFILHSKPLLYNQKNPSKKFRKFLLEKTKINSIIEMSSVRKLVFKNADAPAVIVSFKYSNKDNLSNKITYISLKPNIFFKLFNIIVIEKNDVKNIAQNLLHKHDWAWKTIAYGFTGDFNVILNLKNHFKTIGDTINNQEPKMVVGAGVQYHDGDKLDAKHLMGRNLLDSQNGIDHFFVNSNKTSIFSKRFIHRPRKKTLFDPPYVLTRKWVNCNNYKLKAVYCEEPFVVKEEINIIKGTKEQKSFLLNLVGLLNSSLYAYLNLMLGSSIGIEREQRFMKEVFCFPYAYCDEIADKVQYIQHIKNQEIIFNNNLNEEIAQLDALVLSVFGLENNKFIDYAINVQIPELTNSKDVDIYKKVSIKELKTYSECFEQQFSLIYERLGKYITINLYPDVLRKFSVFELCISDNKPEQKIKISNVVDANKELLTRFCISKYNDTFYQVRDVIHFEENSFYIIKPNYYKNWHPAIAELDLADVIDQIMSNSGGEE